MQYNVTITKKGQMTLPVEYRRKFKLRPGRAKARIQGNSITIEQNNDWEKDLAALQSKVRAHMEKHGLKPIPPDELDDVINRAGEEGATEYYLHKEARNR